MNALYFAGQIVTGGGGLIEKPRSEDEFYAEYRPHSLHQLMPFISAVSAVGAWLVLLGMIPR